MSQTFRDPQTGRPYTVDPHTGQSRWVDVPPVAYQGQQQTPAARPWWRRKRVLIPAGFTALVVAAVATSGGGGGSTSTTSGSAGPAVSQPAQVVSARTLTDAFDRNKVVATKTWKGHRVRVASKVTNISDDTVTLAGDGSKEFTLTQFACRLADKNQTGNVSNDDQATVEGTIGGQNLGVIELKDCAIK